MWSYVLSFYNVNVDATRILIVFSFIEATQYSNNKFRTFRFQLFP